MRKIFLFAPLALAACATTSPPPPVHGGSNGGTCRGDDLARFAGQPASQELGAEIRRESGARVLRWVAHGMMVTMDYREDRVTVWLTADNRVERANCG